MRFDLGREAGQGSKAEARPLSASSHVISFAAASGIKLACPLLSLYSDDALRRVLAPEGGGTY